MKDFKILRLNSRDLLMMSMGSGVPVQDGNVYDLHVESVEIPTLAFYEQNLRYINDGDDRFWLDAEVVPFDHNGFDEGQAKQASKVVLMNRKVKSVKVTHSAGYRPVLVTSEFNHSEIKKGDVFALGDKPIVFIDNTHFFLGGCVGYGQFMESLSDRDVNTSRALNKSIEWLNAVKSSI